MFRLVVAALLSVAFLVPASAQSTRGAADLSSPLVLIATRDALLHFLKDESDFNPLSRLSLHARARLVDTLVVDSNGRITSIYTEDIRQELPPVDAYRVLAMFGAQGLADRVNNGQAFSATDSAVKNRARAPSWLDRHYCNGGYCTFNTLLACNPSSCQPPQ